MRINANSLVPATCALVISSTVGSGKSIYHKYMVKVIEMLREGIEVLDRPIWDENLRSEENRVPVNDSIDVSQIYSNELERKANWKKVFIRRQMLRNLGTKEG